MTDNPTQPEGTEPDDAETSSGSASKDPTGVEGANPALDDTGNLKAAEGGESSAAPDNVEDLDLTPEGLADEPAKEEDPDNPAQPENS